MAQKSNNKKSYSNKLYSTCNYMIKHVNLFKKYAIYNNRIALEADDKVMALHNCLITSYNFLTGNSCKKTNAKDPKGSGIMPVLRLEDLSEEKLAIILSLFYEHTYQNHKSTDLFFNINIEKGLPLLNNLIKKLNSDYIDDIQNVINESKNLAKQEQIDENDYCRVLDRVYNLYKCSIEEYLPINLTEKLSTEYRPFMSESNYFYNILINNESLSKKSAKVIRSLEDRYPHFGNLKSIYYVWLYCDLNCKALLQLITNLLTCKQFIFSIKELKELNSTILNLIHEFPSQSIEAKGSPEEILFYFTAYYYMRDKFLQDTKILKYITKTCEKHKNPKPEYRIPILHSSPQQYSMGQIRKIFTEGQKVNPRTFQENYNMCKDGIEQFNKKTHRDIPNHLISQKAFYREIYADKTPYKEKRHTSRQIFSRFLKNNTINEADYYFLNEKLNMGIYREYSLVNKFYAKNIFQENLYCLISLALSKLYPDQIYDSLHEIFYAICCKLFLIFGKLGIDYKTIYSFCNHSFSSSLETESLDISPQLYNLL